MVGVRESAADAVRRQEHMFQWAQLAKILVKVTRLAKTLINLSESFAN